MLHGLDFLHRLTAAGFAGGCLLLSVMLGALFGLTPERAADVMHTLLPRMGSVMAPLLVLSASSALLLAALKGAPRRRARWIVAAALSGAALVTAVVHLPINDQLLHQDTWSAAQASALLERWLHWHHLRTALALVALGVCSWPAPAQARAPRSA